MRINERLRQRDAGQRDVSYSAGADILLVIAAVLLTSPLSGIRIQAQVLSYLPTHLIIWAFLLGSICLTLIAISEVGVEQYGQLIGIVFILTGVSGTLTYGSLTNLYWSAWGTSFVLIGICLNIIWYLNLVESSPLSLPTADDGSCIGLDQLGVMYKNPIQLFLILVAAIIILRFGVLLAPLLAGQHQIGALAPFVGCLVVFYVPLRWAGIDADREVASFVIIAVLAWIILGFYFGSTTHVFGTDAMLFSQYSLDLLITGQNPYNSSMAPAFERYPVKENFVTYRIDGTIVNSLSYPAGAILAFLPQHLFDIQNLNYTTLGFFALILVFLTRDVSGALRFASIAILLSTQEFLFFSSGGVFDIIYIGFLLVGMKFWANEAYRAAALLVGLGFTIKQVPWIIGPFLAIWLYRTADSKTDFFHYVRGTLGYGFVGFLIPNLPFILWNPIEWIRGVFTPIAGGAPLTMQGIGLVSLSSMSIYYLPREYYLLLDFITLTALLLLYAYYFERLKWAAWVLPSIVYFVHFRSLINYFIYFPILGYYAVILRYRITVPIDEYRPLRWLKGATKIK
jgi:uncharacterized membrane protein